MLRIAQKVRSFARRSLSSLGLRPPSAFAWPKTANTSEGDARYIFGGASFQALKSAASRRRRSLLDFHGFPERTAAQSLRAVIDHDRHEFREGLLELREQLLALAVQVGEGVVDSQRSAIRFHWGCG